MMTGNFTNWAGNIAEIGAVYPFVGSEGFLFILGLIFWLGWHYCQNKMEQEEMSDLPDKKTDNS